eukprot:TRINITY_DN22126_c0_g1_i1.p1 TRINITY_DN22126_c0_g1~~TRINITY_DN22126_c0_g1_i1.p1  ORF type:complete len:584 (-),score=82.26 TRINITY_DN22126_c0_g1_i1:132-1847(-)
MADQLLTLTVLREELRTQLEEFRKTILEEFTRGSQLNVVEELMKTVAYDECQFQQKTDSYRSVEGAGFHSKRGAEGLELVEKLLHADGRMDVKVVKDREDDRVSRGSRDLQLTQNSRDVEASLASWCSLDAIVRSDAFSSIISTCVVLNAVFMGVEIDHAARHGGGGKMPISQQVNTAFCYVFLTEVSLRLCVYGYHEFFRGQDWTWNMFDFVLVTFQVMDQTTALLSDGKEIVSSGLLRTLRILRMVRILRLARILHLVVELRTMISSIAASLKPLLWATILFGMLIYSFAIMLMDSVNEYRSKNEHGVNDKLDKYFSSLNRAVLSLWQCISGGMDWQDMADPLMDEISPWMGWALTAYVGFATLTMMNVITGIFVDSAQSYAQQDKDAYVVKAVLDIFKQTELDEEGNITWDVFSRKLGTSEMQELFLAVDVDVQDAESLFKLIDVEENGTISCDELMNGWMRLRGPAKALDQSLMVREMTRANIYVGKQMAALSATMNWVCDALTRLSSSSSSSHDAPKMQQMEYTPAIRAAGRRNTSIWQKEIEELSPVESPHHSAPPDENGYTPLA